MISNYKKIIYFSLIAAALCIGKANAQTINTVAGNGSMAYSGDGGAATAASFNTPIRIAADAAGNYYVMDALSTGRIRKVTTAGVVTTFAGNGSTGYSGDGGAATAATLSIGLFDADGGLAVDGSGNVYISDSWNNVIRKVSTSGVITTFAGNGTAGFGGDGGAATAAMIDTPGGIAVDGSGNLYIADQRNSRIRKVNTSGIITTIAGNGTAGFAGDGGAATAAQIKHAGAVTADASGNIYISDWPNERLRKVSTSGIITTIGGNGSSAGGSTFPGDGGAATAACLGIFGGVAVDASGDIYIASDFGVRKIDAATGIITTVAGVNAVTAYSGDGGPATAAKLSEAMDLAFDGSHNLYIADAANYRVRKVTGLGSITTGITEIANPINVTVFPNPNKGIFMIKVASQSANDENASIEVVDMLGRKVYQTTSMTRNGNINVQIEPDSIEGGVYLVNVTVASGNVISQFVIER